MVHIFKSVRMTLWGFAGGGGTFFVRNYLDYDITIPVEFPLGFVDNFQKFLFISSDFLRLRRNTYWISGSSNYCFAACNFIIRDMNFLIADRRISGFFISLHIFNRILARELKAYRSILLQYFLEHFRCICYRSSAKRP